MFDQIRTHSVLGSHLPRKMQSKRTCHRKSVFKEVLFKLGHPVAAQMLRTVEGVIGALYEGIDTRSV